MRRSLRDNTARRGLRGQRPLLQDESQESSFVMFESAEKNDRPFAGLVEFSAGFRPRPEISHVLFDFDGTLSLIRQGWPEVMVPMFVEMLPRRGGETEADIQRLAYDDIMRLNGKQTIYQMIQLAERVAAARRRARGNRCGTSTSTSAASTSGSATASRDCGAEGSRPTTCWSMAAGNCWSSFPPAGSRSTWPAAPTSRSSRPRPSCSTWPATSARGSTGHRTTTRTSPSRWSSSASSAKTRSRASGCWPSATVTWRSRTPRGWAAWPSPWPATRPTTAPGTMDPWKRQRLLGVGADVVIPDFRDAEALLLSIDSRCGTRRQPPARGSDVSCVVTVARLGSPPGPSLSAGRAEEPDARRGNPGRSGRRAQPLDARLSAALDDMAAKIRAARQRGAAVMLIYGAHLLRNGAARILDALMAQGWLTHLATNGAGTIHDWEYRLAGPLDGKRPRRRRPRMLRHLGRNGPQHPRRPAGRRRRRRTATGGPWADSSPKTASTLPEPAELEDAIRREPAHPLTAARAELLAAMRRARPAGRPLRDAAPLERGLDPGRRLPPRRADHRASGHRLRHHRQPSDVQRRGDRPGRRSAISPSSPAAVERLDGGVVLSVGSAIMGPQVFEKSLSCVNNSASRPAGRSSPATRSTSSTSRTAAAGTGPRASRPRPTPPIISASARATPAWAEPCVTCNATTWHSSSSVSPLTVQVDRFATCQASTVS